MRRPLLFAGISLLCVGIVHCVDKTPDAATSGADGSPDDDGSTADHDAMTGGDGSTIVNDGGSTTDSGVDSGPPPPNDECVGNTDCPSNVEVSSLKLWLRSNIGATCTGGRISAWSDQSTNENNAQQPTTLDGGVALAPECGSAKINTHDVVSFTAPTEPDGGDFTQYVDETLNIDLSFVNGSSYTLIVVHHRFADKTFGLIGQDYDIVPGGGLFIACESIRGRPPAQSALSFMYAALDDGGQGLADNQYCFGGAAFALADTYVAGTTTVDETVFSTATGHALYTNGAAIFTGDAGATDLEAVTNGDNHGIIGRSFNRFTTDTRYQGEVAEIIGYNTALSDAERAQLEGYLKRQWGLSF